MAVALPENTSRTQIPAPIHLPVAILLQHLSPGQLAEVSGFEGSNHDISRLAEMGLRRGTIVSVTRGGITSIVQLLNGSRLCVRTSSELKVFVTPI